MGLELFCFPIMRKTLERSGKAGAWRHAVLGESLFSQGGWQEPGLSACGPEPTARGGCLEPGGFPCVWVLLLSACQLLGGLHCTLTWRLCGLLPSGVLLSLIFQVLTHVGTAAAVIPVGARHWGTIGVGRTGLMS